MMDGFNPDEMDRVTLIVAREAVSNLLVNDWSNMDRDGLREAEADMARALGYEPEFLEAE